MLKTKTISNKTKSLMLLIAVAILPALVFIVNSSGVEAASQTAQRECAGLPLAKNLKAACEYGYDQGRAGKNVDKLCKDKYNNASFLNACKTGGQKGSADRTARGNTGSTTKTGFQCGNHSDSDRNVHTKFNFGCQGSSGPANLNPIIDLALALIKFLSIGVGIAVVISIIIAGIQYSASEGNAENTQKAKDRVRSAIIGLVIYIFIFAILQYLIPGGVFNS